MRMNLRGPLKGDLVARQPKLKRQIAEDGLPALMDKNVMNPLHPSIALQQKKPELELFFLQRKCYVLQFYFIQ